MFKNVFQKVFGDSDSREIGRLQPVVDEINRLGPEFAAMSDEDLRAQTLALRERIAEKMHDLRQELAEARGAWQEERASAERVQVQVNIERLERELRAAEASALQEILPQAFAAVREAATRTIGLRHYDVQLLGGMILHDGKIAEMKTGEGKTLVASLPLYLNALLGQGCHLVTVNDYLARRDGGWMGRIYHLLGLSVGLVINGMSALYDPDYVVPGAGQEDERLVHWRTVPRREAYQADITYGTNNEYGFDYLRDNIARDITLTVQRPLNYAIVDEVDNILVDEARTPLIISGPAEEATDQYRRFAELVRRLRPNTAGEDAPPNGHFNIDLKTKSVTLTESGIIKIEEMLEEVNVEAGESLYDPQHYELTHYVDNAMRAQYAYHRDRDYVEQNGEIIIVDPNTGRLMQGRRYSEGLHEAIEAKEGVVVQRETMTLATITIQNYFRMYRKRAGMTGTAKTEQEEFHKIYNLDVVAIPTNVEYMASQSRELVEVARKQDGAQVIEYQRKDQPGKPVFFKRADYPDRIFASWKSKYEAVVEEIRERIEQGRPVLVGTISVESSELLSRELERAKIKHTVLNAKLHEKEAHVIVQAGQPGVVTIATNMAGRGTDILLGGNPEGLAMQLVEERCFTVQDAARLARQVVAGQVDQARRDGAGQPGIVDAIVRMHQEFEENVAWVELPGGVPLQVAVRHLVPEFGVTQSTGRDLAALVAAGLGYSAEQRADKLGLRPEIVPWLTRFYNSLAQYMSVSDKGEFLGRRVYEDHYKARAALVRLVLHDELEAARELVRATPALPAELMPAIQGVKRRCADDRQRIWQAGGLHIIGTERHEARRIDNQLRGRSARQGDPGSSQFFVSFDDELMRRFGGERIQGILGRLGGDENVELPASGTLSKTIENLQTKAEAYNYDIRKHLLEFDNVVNKQREVIYSRRRSILEGQRYDLEGEVRRLFLNILEERIDQYTTGYDNWAAGEIDQAIAACSNPVTDEVNAPAVLQRLGGIFAIDAATADELADADAGTLREELKAVAAEAAEHGRPYDLLAIELHNLLLFLPPLPSVEAIYGARSVAEARDGTRGAYLAQLTGLLDRLRSAVAERGGTVDEAAFREQRQHAADGVRKIFEIVGRERPSRDQLKQEQRAVERQLSDLAVETVAHCLAGIPRTELHTLAEGLFEQKLAEAYEQLGRGNYAGLDTAEARAQDLKSLSELDAEVLRTNLAGILSVLDRDRLAALIDDLCQDAADADRDAWEALGRSRDIAALDDDQVTALGTALFDSLSPEVRSMLAGLSAERVGVQAMREFCQAEMLGAIDVFWPQHLTAMDELREGIGLQAFAQRDPLVEFSRQSFGGFERLLVEIDRTVIDHFFQDLPRYQAVVAQHRESLRMQEHLALSGARVDQSGAVRKTGNLGRNDPCWCGSGKKYKYCHMRSDQAQAGGPAPQAAVTQAAAAVSNGRSAPRGAPPAKSKAGKRK